MEPIAMAITWADFSAALAGFVGVGVFMIGLSGSNHYGGNKHLARRYFWFTLLGAALFDVGTYLLQFHSSHSQPGGDGFFVATWGCANGQQHGAKSGRMNPRQSQRMNPRLGATPRSPPPWTRR
jgi:hypothetical protein